MGKKRFFAVLVGNRLPEKSLFADLIPCFPCFQVSGNLGISPNLAGKWTNLSLVQVTFGRDSFHRHENVGH